MAIGLSFYLAGCVPAILAVALIAFNRRASHGMELRAVTALTVFSGLIWPLLAVAALQVVVLLVPVKVLRAVRGLVNRAPQPAAEQVSTSLHSVEEQTPAGVEQAVVAA